MTKEQKEFIREVRYCTGDGSLRISDYLRTGMSPDTKDENGTTALYNAIHSASPNWKLIDLLLQYNADPDLADTGNLQMTPLMHALLTGYKKLVIGLLKKGADPSKKDALGLTAADYLALLLNDDEALSSFTKHYASLTSGIYIPESIYEWIKPPHRQFPYYKYYEDLKADSAASCLICKHFRNHPNGESYIDTGIPGVYAWNRIVYQLFEEISNEIRDGLSWRTYEQDIYAKCIICKSRYHYHRWWDDEFGSFVIEETLKKI